MNKRTQARKNTTPQNRASLYQILNSGKKKTIAVIGDIMLDHYCIGEVTRISPEAPTPIMVLKQETFTLGGAGNTATNIVALGGHVHLFGVVGKDSSGRKIKKLAQKLSGNKNTILEDSAMTTIEKMRIVTSNQQIARVDREKEYTMSEVIEKKLFLNFEKILPQLDAVVFSDYTKGFLNKKRIKTLLSLARKYKKPIIVDSKPQHFPYFKGVTVLTPNRTEAETFVGFACCGNREIYRAGNMLRKALRSSILITRGADGMSLFEKKSNIYFPSNAREVFDVTGAGDTVVSTLALGIASGATLSHAAELANIAAGLVVRKKGTATISWNELRDALNHEV